MTETVNFITRDGTVHELTREEIAISTRYATIWMSCLEALVTGATEPEDLFAKLMFLGAMLERGSDGFVDKLVDTIAKVGEQDPTDFREKTAKLVTEITRPFNDEEWEKARTVFDEQNDRHRREKEMSERLYGREEAKPFA